MIDALKPDPMMNRLMTALKNHQDIGHYGRLVFCMIARHFADDAAIVKELQQDKDFSKEQAEALLRDVEAADYSPPKRAKILDFQSKQDFQLIEDVSDPDAGNVYKTLDFPEAVYEHIAHYRDEKSHASA